MSEIKETKECPYCKEEILEKAIKCKHCGEFLEQQLDKPNKVALWNPNVLGFLSLPLTPIFSSYLTYKNWITLKQEEKAYNAKKWLYINTILFILNAFLGLFSGASLYPLIVIFSYLVTVRSQYSYVKNELKDNYERKSWVKPILIALSLIIVYYLMFIGLGYVLAESGILVQTNE